MGEKLNLKAIERKAYLSYHQDGLIDLFVGIAITAFGALIAYDPSMAAIAGGTIAVVPAMYTAAKKLVTIPRLGYVKFASQRKYKIRNVVLFLVVAGVLGNVAGVFALINRPFVIFLAENYMIVVGVLGAAIFGLAAYLSEVKRFYAYGAANLIAFPSGHILPTATYQHIILLGAIITVSGAVLLSRFVHKYPKVNRREAQ